MGGLKSMADDAPVRRNNDVPGLSGANRSPAEAVEISSRDFRESFGEDLNRTLDLDTWRAGQDLSQEYSRIEAEVREAVQREDALLQNIRREVFPRLGGFSG